MRLSGLIRAAVVFAMVLAVAPLRAQQEPTSDRPRDATSIVGKWSGTMFNGREDQPVTFEFAVEGTKVTGTFKAFAPVPLEGQFVDSKLTFSVKTQSRDAGPGSIEFWATLKTDGSLEGALSPRGLPELPWRAKRVTP